MRLLEMLDAARAGKLKAMLIIGENPARSLPASAKAADALEKLDLLIVQELFLTETARLADVVLPACSYAEKTGTFTNSEGFVQKVRPGLEPVGDSRPDWEILSALSVMMGYPLEYGDAKEILKEIRAVIPGYRVLGATAEPARVDTQAVEQYVAGGFTEDLSARYSAGAEPKTNGHRWSLAVGQTLFHSGTMSTKAQGLLELQHEGKLIMNQADAQRLGITEGDRVRLTSTSGEATVPVTMLGRIPEGTLFFPESFKEALASLPSMIPDPVTGVPYSKQLLVSVEKKVGTGGARVPAPAGGGPPPAVIAGGK
jgi:formate dehydrogenase alpha subunit